MNKVVFNYCVIDVINLGYYVWVDVRYLPTLAIFSAPLNLGLGIVSMDGTIENTNRRMLNIHSTYND